MLPTPVRDVTITEQRPMIASAAGLDRGDTLCHDVCQFCHGTAVRVGGEIPVLRLISTESHETFIGIVIGGLKKESGMASFADVLAPEDALEIQQYSTSRANLDKDAEEKLQTEDEAQTGEG